MLNNRNQTRNRLSDNRDHAKGNAKRTRINQYIFAPTVRLIGQNGEQVGIVSAKEALALARDAELDLVEIVPTANPPVCRIMDYGKYLFELGKKQKKKTKQVLLKEIKIRPATEEADYQVKLKKIISFLEDKNKVKITIQFKGREIAYQNQGMELLSRMQNDLGENISVEQMPKVEGRQMTMVISQKRK